MKNEVHKKENRKRVNNKTILKTKTTRKHFKNKVIKNNNQKKANLFKHLPLKIIKSTYLYTLITIVLLIISISIATLYKYNSNNKTTTTSKTTKITTTRIANQEMNVFGCFGGNTIKDVLINGRIVSIYFYGIQLENNKCLSVVYADTTLLAKTYKKYEFYRVANYKDVGIVLLGNKTGYGPSSYSRTSWYLKIYNLDGEIIFQDSNIYAKDITVDVIIDNKITYMKKSYNKESKYTVEYIKNTAEPYFKKTKIQ